MSWIGNIYWYLEDYSCVLVPRNKKWFNSILPQLKTLWNIVLSERETGYEHRKPKSRNKKITNEKVSNNLEQNIVIKVRTESFDNFKENTIE